MPVKVKEQLDKVQEALQKMPGAGEVKAEVLKVQEDLQTMSDKGKEEDVKENMVKVKEELQKMPGAGGDVKEALKTAVDELDKGKEKLTPKVKEKMEKVQEALEKTPGAGELKEKLLKVQEDLQTMSDTGKAEAVKEVKEDLQKMPGTGDANLPFASSPASAKGRCTDIPEETMAARGLSCEGFSWMFIHRCNANASMNKYRNRWIKKKFCQKSCWLNGNGYDGDDCSGDDDADSVQTGSTPQPSEERDKDSQLTEEESVHLERQQGPIHTDYFQDEALAEIQAMPTSPLTKPTKPCKPTQQKKEGEKLEEKAECKYREWTDWSECRPFCSGKRTRVRETNMGKQSDRHCSETSEEDTCSNICVDCEWGSWTEWSSCPAAEDGQTQQKNRTRKQATSKQGGGKDCTGPETETQECSKDCVFSDWSEWTVCEPCSMEQQSRSRHLQQESKASCHSSPLQEKKICWDKGCSNPCKWGDWHDWEPCSKTCGEDATRQRGRNHKKTHLPGGIKCTGVDIEVAPCNHIQACPDQSVKPHHKKKSLLKKSSAVDTAKP